MLSVFLFFQSAQRRLRAMIFSLVAPPHGATNGGRHAESSGAAKVVGAVSTAPESVSVNHPTKGPAEQAC